MAKNRVVITAMAGLCAAGSTPEEIFQAALDGRSGISPVTIYELDPGHHTHVAAQVPDSDRLLLSGVEKREQKRMARGTQFMLHVVQKALRASGISLEDLSPEKAQRIGVIVGASLLGMRDIIEASIKYSREGARHIPALLIPKIMPNAAAAVPAIQEGLHGPVYSTSAACATSGMALIDAYKAVADGECDVVITGGCEDALDPVSGASFANAKATSRRNSEPKRSLRPFDIDRDGFVEGEGAAAFVFESLSHAKKRGAEILSEVLGYARNCDAYHLVAPQPDGFWQALCMKTALKRARISISRLSYINAHGTGTADGDAAESRAIKSVLGSWAKKVWISSTKPITGHMMSAAAAIELLITVMAVVKNRIPPTTNLETIDPDCEGIRHLQFKPVEEDVRTAASNSFGFGGENTTIVVGKFKD